MRASEKVMFEIYREGSYNRRYKVVYFTELGEHDKDTEINRAMAGDHFYDGFLIEETKEQAKAVIDQTLARLNDGESLEPDQVATVLAEYLA